MTEAAPEAQGRTIRTFGAGRVLTAILAVVLLLAALAADSTTGRVLYGGGAVLSMLLGVGRWSPLHGVSAAIVVTLLAQPVLAQVITSPIRHQIPNRAYTIRTEIPGVRDGSIVTTDARGFRPTGEARPDDPSRRIVLIGGSTFEQIYIADRATTGWLLADALGDEVGGTEVINTGVAGLRAADHLVHVRYFGRDADRYEDTHLVVMMGLNDWNLHVTRDVIGEPAAWSEPAVAPWRDVDTYPLVRVVAELRVRFLAEPPDYDATAVEMGRYDERPKVDVSDEQLAAMLERYRVSIGALMDACSGLERTRCTFVTQPTVYRPENLVREDVRRTLWTSPPFVEPALGPEALVRVSRAFNDTLLAEVAAGDCARCATVDADRALEGRTELFYDDCHFTEAGAAALAAALVEGGVLDRP